jgi:acyl-CoA thioester hydrolase
VSNEETTPALAPRTAPLDVAPFDVPHPHPFLCDVQMDGLRLSRAVPHVSNIEFVRWIDRAAELHADHLGYTRRAMVQKGIMWFVARHEIDYLAEAWPDDELVVATWVRDMQRIRSWRDTIVARPADKTVLCRAATLWVLVDLTTRRPTRIDAAMAEDFSPLEPPLTTQRCTLP